MPKTGTDLSQGLHHKSTTGKSSSDEKTPHFSGFRVPASMTHIGRELDKLPKKKAVTARKESFDTESLSSYQNMDSSSRDKSQNQPKVTVEAEPLTDHVNTSDSKGTAKPLERLSFLIVDSGSHE